MLASVSQNVSLKPIGSHLTLKIAKSPRKRPKPIRHHQIGLRAPNHQHPSKTRLFRSLSDAPDCFPSHLSRLDPILTATAL